jgi:hypothetical protein
LSLKKILIVLKVVVLTVLIYCLCLYVQSLAKLGSKIMEAKSDTNKTWNDLVAANPELAQKHDKAVKEQQQIADRVFWQNLILALLVLPTFLLIRNRFGNWL